MTGVRLATWLATGLGIGRLPVAPGTWASLAALPLAWIIVAPAGASAPAVLLAAALLVFAVGVWASGIYVRAHGREDPVEIVIDEVAGQWLTLAALPVDPGAWLVGFLVFRACDIVKPWPASWADRRVKGGLGVMLDDALAGLWAAALAWLAWTGLGML